MPLRVESIANLAKSISMTWNVAVIHAIQFYGTRNCIRFSEYAERLICAICGLFILLHYLAVTIYNLLFRRISCWWLSILGDV